MKLFKCDRCGSVHEDVHTTPPWRPTNDCPDPVNRGEPIVEWHLGAFGVCQECYHDFNEWMMANE